VKEFVDRVCALEGAEAGYATASGMSSVFASFMALLKKGDHLLSCNAIFGSTIRWLQNIYRDMELIILM
jgi:O-succinylhomoserine sulfhydrylase